MPDLQQSALVYLNSKQNTGEHLPRVIVATRGIGTIPLGATTIRTTVTSSVLALTLPSL